jgi:glycosyltransferase involved in cell wall biosynthesis
MHIAIDARSLFTGGGGDRTYFRNLIMEMARLAPGDRWTLYADSHDADRDTLSAPNVAVAPPLRAPVGALWNVTHLLPQIRRDGADLLHSQYMLPPVGPVPCPMVVTIHDATFRLFPAWFPRRANRVQNLLIPLSARRAARVITGSRSAAADIHRSMGISEDKIVVTPYGLDERFRTAAQSEQQRVREQYGLTGDYVLGVGLLRLRKNVRVVLEAMLALIERGAWPEGAVLALTGSWSGVPEAAAFFEGNPLLAQRARVLDYVPDDDLPALYSAAAFSVYPSLYEGFGFPVLESMACGTPVIATSTSSLPEVAGQAGLLLSPEDVSGWAGALESLLHDPGERAHLRRLGLAQAATFTWERTARETLAVYRALIGEGR